MYVCVCVCVCIYIYCIFYVTQQPNLGLDRLVFHVSRITQTHTHTHTHTLCRTPLDE